MKCLACPDCKSTNLSAVRLDKYNCLDCFKVFHVPAGYMTQAGRGQLEVKILLLVFTFILSTVIIAVAENL